MFGIKLWSATIAFSQVCMGVDSFVTKPLAANQGILTGRDIRKNGKLDSGVVMLFQESDDNGFEIRADTGYRPSSTFGAEAVPEGQRPSNEYLELRSSPMFEWASQESGNKGLLVRLAAIYGVFYAVSYVISTATFTREGYFLNALASSNVGAMGIVFLVLVRLYSGWGYIGARLKDNVIEYEETGWYDGDVELKTDAEKARDLFLYRSDVMPVEERLKTFTLAAGALWLASCVTLNLVMSANPLFDEYDPEMLKQLSGNDKLSNVAASQSNGRPTYCDSRYYNAVATGGRGC